MYKNMFRITLMISLLLSMAPTTMAANAKKNDSNVGGTTSGLVTVEEITSLLTNYSNYLSSGTKNLIDPTVSRLLDERKSFYNELFDVGLNSKLKTIKSAFDIENMDIIESDGGYSVKIIETVTLAGKYKLEKSADYPIIKAGKWALQHTTDAKAISAIQDFIGRQTMDVEESLGDIKGFETSLSLNHQILILKTDTGLRIMSDIFDDKGPSDPAGIDVVNWTENYLQRTKRDLMLMPDYHISHTAIAVLGQEILNSFTAPNKAALACAKPEPRPIGMTLDPTLSLASYHPRGKSALEARPLFTYNHTTAKNYINTWTSAATGSCPGFPTIRWDVTKYNNGQYNVMPLCNDCTNYVSQALYAGGIPTSATWQPYTTAWVNVTALLNYLASTGAGTDSQPCNAAGDLAYLPDKSHIVMIGAVAPLRYSGHTNDRLPYTWNASIVCMRMN